jgi:hypothetical protein
LRDWTKLLMKFISSSLQILDIFGFRENRIFELQNYCNVSIIRKTIVHRIGPGPVLQSPTRGWFQTAQHLSEPRPPPAPLFSDRRTPPAGSDRAAVFRAHMRRPRALLYHLRAQRQRLPFRILLFVVAISAPLSTEHRLLDRSNKQYLLLFFLRINSIHSKSNSNF